ncbi:MAG: TetR/AcrR family transcriptional regulator [Methylococcaceae bacterium]|nr:MAG: TetR/AcrR family transcriptional regulator [Methylococcaceae bacterium]
MLLSTERLFWTGFVSIKEKIRKEAMILFAEKGYSAVSMRQVAATAKVSVAGIYHHYPDKKALYLDAVRYAFSGKEEVFNKVWALVCPPEQTLVLFIRALFEVLIADRTFHRLLQYEIMNADAERLQLLAESIFHQQFSLLMHLVRKLAPTQDAHLMAATIIILVEGMLRAQPINRYFPGRKPEHDQLEVMAEHVTQLVLRALQAH